MVSLVSLDTLYVESPGKRGSVRGGPLLSLCSWLWCEPPLQVLPSGLPVMDYSVELWAQINLFSPQLLFIRCFITVTGIEPAQTSCWCLFPLGKVFSPLPEHGARNSPQLHLILWIFEKESFSPKKVFSDTSYLSRACCGPGQLVSVCTSRTTQELVSRALCHQPEVLILKSH